MRKIAKYCFAGAAVALLGAGVAQAATQKIHAMNVATPDGQVVEVRYTGDVAPQVQFVPPMQQVSMADPFAEMERISDMMDAQMHAMMQRAAVTQQIALQQAALAQQSGGIAQPGFTMTGTLPQGAQVSYFSSSTDANGCTRTVSYSSDGSSAQPKVTQAASDGCQTATSSAPTPVKAVVPASPPKAEPGQKV